MRGRGSASGSGRRRRSTCVAVSLAARRARRACSLTHCSLFFVFFLVVQITRHVAEIIQRQEFILKLARAMMMFGGPTHRLQAQMQSTARVLDIELSCMYLPDVMLISFDDAATSTSNIKFIRQSSALDIGKLQEAHKLYWKVRASERVLGAMAC